MTLKPCAVCGEPTSGTRCDEHRLKDTRVRKGKGQAAYDPVWRRLSAKVRRESPFCQDCGAVDDLTADHIIPQSVAPELVHATENLAVRCRSCNSHRGATGFTDDDAQAVLTRLQATYRRRPTANGRHRMNAAQRARDQGGGPIAAAPQAEGKAKFALHTGDAR